MIVRITNYNPASSAGLLLLGEKNEETDISDISGIICVYVFCESMSLRFSPLAATNLQTRQGYSLLFVQSFFSPIDYYLRRNSPPSKWDLR